MWRGERWLKYIWSTISQYTNLDIQDYSLSYYLQNNTYIMFNAKTKKVIIGSTSGSIYDRFKQHLSGKTDNLSKKAANYIINLGIEQWIILPLQHLTEKSTSKLYQLEGKWANLFKNFLINNPIQLVQYKPTSKPKNNKKEIRDLKRAKHRTEKFLNWNNYTYLIFRTDLWKTWHELPLINLLINVKKSRIPTITKDIFTYIIRNHLQKNNNISLKPYYNISIPYTRYNIIPKLQSWIKQVITNNSNSAYYLYIATHFRIIQESPIKLNQLIANYKQTLQNFQHNYNTIECNCHLYPQLTTNSTHINLKHSELPYSFRYLQDLLSLPSKTPIYLTDRMFKGIIFNNIRKLSDQTKVQLTWTNNQNQKLFEILNNTIQYTKPPYLLLKQNIKEIINSLKQHLVFCPLDKNNNSWAIICKHLYIQNHINEFNNTSYYSYIGGKPTYWQSKIKKEFETNIIPLLKHNTILAT